VLRWIGLCVFGGSTRSREAQYSGMLFVLSVLSVCQFVQVEDRSKSEREEKVFRASGKALLVVDRDGRRGCELWVVVDGSGWLLKVHAGKGNEEGAIRWGNERE